MFRGTVGRVGSEIAQVFSPRFLCTVIRNQNFQLPYFVLMKIRMWHLFPHVCFTYFARRSWVLGEVNTQQSSRFGVIWTSCACTIGAGPISKLCCPIMSALWDPLKHSNNAILLNPPIFSVNFVTVSQPTKCCTDGTIKYQFQTRLKDGLTHILEWIWTSSYGIVDFCSTRFVLHNNLNQNHF